MATEKKAGKSILLRLAVLAFAVYMIISLTSLWSQLVVSKKELGELEKDAKERELKISELSRLLEDGDETEIIEKAARERLGYVYADEQVYVDISGS